MEGWRFTFVLTGAFGLLVGIIAIPSLDGSERLRGLGDLAKDQWHLMELLKGRKRNEEEEEKKKQKNIWNTLVELFTTKTFLLLFLRSALGEFYLFILNTFLLVKYLLYVLTFIEYNMIFSFFNLR